MAWQGAPLLGSSPHPPCGDLAQPFPSKMPPPSQPRKSCAIFGAPSLSAEVVGLDDRGLRLASRGARRLGASSSASSRLARFEHSRQHRADIMASRVGRPVVRLRPSQAKNANSLVGRLRIGLSVGAASPQPALLADTASADGPRGGAVSAAAKRNPKGNCSTWPPTMASACMRQCAFCVSATGCGIQGASSAQSSPTTFRPSLGRASCPHARQSHVVVWSGLGWVDLGCAGVGWAGLGGAGV